MSSTISRNTRYITPGGNSTSRHIHGDPPSFSTTRPMMTLWTPAKGSSSSASSKDLEFLFVTLFLTTPTVTRKEAGSPLAVSPTTTTTFAHRITQGNHPTNSDFQPSVNTVAKSLKRALLSLFIQFLLQNTPGSAPLGETVLKALNTRDALA